MCKRRYHFIKIFPTLSEVLETYFLYTGREYFCTFSFLPTHVRKMKKEGQQKKARSNKQQGNATIDYVTGLETRHVRSQYTILYCTLARRRLRVAFLRWFGLNCLWDSIYKNGGLGNEACLY